MDSEQKVTVSGLSTPENNGEYAVFDAPEMQFKASVDAVAAAEKALGEMKTRSFSARNPELGKMINCQVCGRRHRRSELKCEQKFKQMWVDEDLETGELTVQKAIVPLPGQSGTAKSVAGAKMFKGKRKQPRPNHTGIEVVELTRKIFARINPERFPEEAGRMLEAKRIAINTLRNKRERKAKQIRKAQKRSRRINRDK